MGWKIYCYRGDGVMKKKEMVEYKALYREKWANPFGPRSPRIASIKVELPADVPVEEIEKMAKDATPNGYEFQEVKAID